MSTVKDSEIAFCTLGVGQPSRVPQEELFRVDVTQATEFAKACKEVGSVKQFTIMTSVRADANSSVYYLRYKATVESNIEQLGFPFVHCFRPSLLVTPEIRYGLQDSIVQYLFPKVSWLLPQHYKEIRVEDIARAMVINSENKMQLGYYGEEDKTITTSIYHWKEMNEILVEKSL